MPFPRSSGVLLHPTSLPGGTLGPEAYRFVDWLAAAGQAWWQLLPLSPPDEYGSPYASSSAFAASPALLADPEASVSARELRRFRERQRYWIDDWAEFAGEGAIAEQVRCEREWTALRRYARERGVRVMGDLALYVAGESCDVLAHPELFQRDVVAGVPPDNHTATGQLWGNPCYDWAAHRAEGFRWWTERFRRLLELGDVVRIDHFRGLVAYWAIARGAQTAQVGTWRRGPGLEFFEAIERRLGRLPIVAEDLGVITPPVRQLLTRIDAPGMRIFEYEFDFARGRNAFVNLPERCVLYTGTHDNPPLAAWWDAIPELKRARVERALRRERPFGAGELDGNGDERVERVWTLMALVHSTHARMAIVQMQDLLALGPEARMNRPGTIGGNWSWRMEPGLLSDELAARLRRLTEATGRLRASQALRQPRRGRTRTVRRARPEYDSASTGLPPGPDARQERIR